MCPTLSEWHHSSSMSLLVLSLRHFLADLALEAAAAADGAAADHPVTRKRTEHPEALFGMVQGVNMHSTVCAASHPRSLCEVYSGLCACQISTLLIPADTPLQSLAICRTCP
jgi:hypothetical protein